MKPSSRRWRNTYGRNFGSCVTASHVDASSARKHGHPTFFLPLLRRNCAEGVLGAGTPVAIALPIKQHRVRCWRTSRKRTPQHTPGSSLSYDTSSAHQHCSLYSRYLQRRWAWGLCTEYLFVEGTGQSQAPAWGPFAPWGPLGRENTCQRAGGLRRATAPLWATRCSRKV